MSANGSSLGDKTLYYFDNINCPMRLLLTEIFACVRKKTDFCSQITAFYVRRKQKIYIFKEK